MTNINKQHNTEHVAMCITSSTVDTDSTTTRSTETTEAALSLLAMPEAGDVVVCSTSNTVNSTTTSNTEATEAALSLLAIQGASNVTSSTPLVQDAIHTEDADTTTTKHLDMYLQQCEFLFRHPVQYFNMVQMAYRKQPACKLRLLDRYKKYEYDLLTYHLQAKADASRDILLGLTNIVHLMSGAPYLPYNMPDYVNFGQRMDTQQDSMFFTESTEIAAQIFFRALSNDAFPIIFHNIARIVYLIKTIMYERVPNQKCRSEVQELVEAQYKDNLQDVVEERSYTDMAMLVNRRKIEDMKLTDEKQHKLRQLMRIIKIKTLLLLHHYSEGVNKVAQKVYAIRNM